jgi:hypothetical protein
MRFFLKVATATYFSIEATAFWGKENHPIGNRVTGLSSNSAVRLDDSADAE